MNYDYKVNIENKNNAHTLCIDFIKPNSKVLDLGCAVGAIGQYLHENKNCTLVGADFSEEFIEICKSKNCYNKLFKIDFNSELDKLSEFQGEFDYVLAADVIEHLYNPKQFLTLIAKFLKKDGKIVLSIPNLAHASTKLNLLKNNFKYTEMGLLDKTHLRFFTRNSIIELFNELNFEIIKDDFVVNNFSTYYENIDIMSHPFNILKHISNSDESFVYQYVIKIKQGNTSKNSYKLLVDKKVTNKLKKQLFREYFKKLKRKIFGKK